MKKTLLPLSVVLLIAFLFFLISFSAGFSNTTSFFRGWVAWSVAEADDSGDVGALYFPYFLPYFISTNGYWTGVGLRNESPWWSADVTVQAFSPTGTVLATETKEIPRRGQRAFMVGMGTNCEGWVKVTSNRPLTGLAFIAQGFGDALMFDMSLVSEPATTLRVPHVAQDGTWDTIVFVCNPISSETTMYISFVDSDGVTVKTSHGFKIPAYGSGRYPLLDLLGKSAYSSGSVEIAASQGVVAFALYHNLKTGLMSYAGISAVEAAATPKPITNSLGMTFAPIPAGTFMMGSPASEYERSSEETLHQVTLTKSFYLQTTEVTQGQWKAVMGSNPSYYSNCGDDCPVEQVSWYDCQSFITSLNQLEGTTKYRLPTEAEWEYACRAGTTTPFNTGNCLSTDEANYDGSRPYSGCSSGIYRQTTVPVKSLSLNAWGLYDMHGNVGEFCQDWYGDYSSSPVTDPVGPSGGDQQVLRGGGWSASASSCRSTNRGHYIPGNWSNFVGFRVARDY
jgi:formylglycine-generating enzyme required for sulfatase activity